MRKLLAQARGVLGRCLLAAVLIAPTGCLSFVNPIAPPEKHLAESCQIIPPLCRKHVYIFLLGGIDPFQFSNLAGLREYLIALGYTKVYHGELYHVFSFASEIEKVHREDPKARFVLAGFSFGANMVRSLANSAGEQNIIIDLLVYLGGNTIKNKPESQPDNVLHIENILATGWIWNGDTLDRAEPVNLPDVWHFGSPSHRKTLEMFARELSVVAARVPLEMPVDPPPPEDEIAPTPRPVSRKPAEPEPDGWDFLQPVRQLRRPPDAAPSGAGSVSAEAGQQPARPVWVRGPVPPGEQNHPLAGPKQ